MSDTGEIDLNSFSFTQAGNKSIRRKMAVDVFGALSEVHSALSAKHPQLTITQRENSVDSKPFLHVWKPVSMSADSL